MLGFALTTNAQQLKINEVMASNSATLASDLGNFGDWVEFYNPTSSAIDLAGLYFTDDMATPTKYQFPIGMSNAIVPANGFKLVWADDSAQNLHANFKLSGTTGETIAIFAADGTTLIDSVSFGVQTTDVSFGRTVDGAVTWTTFATPTPEASNGPTTIQNNVEKYQVIQIFPNPITHNFRITQNDWNLLEINDLSGKLIISYSKSHILNNLVDVSFLNNGLYIITITTATKLFTARLIKN